MRKQTEIIAILFVVLLFTNPLTAQDKQPGSRFSHKGLKLAIGGGGNFENEFNRFGGTLKEGSGGFLSLGYGFDNHFSLWLTALGMEHPRLPNGAVTNFLGGEINLQYKPLTETRLQPYGKVGIGIYAMAEQDADTAFVASGFAASLGLDFFFSRHFGLGVEFQFKELDYFTRLDDLEGDTTDTVLNPQLDGKSRGIVLTLTIQ